MTLTFDQFAKIADDAGLAIRPYSGRFMFGQSCVGIATDAPYSAIADLVVATVNDGNVDLQLVDGLTGLIHDTRQDSLGNGVILYWPELKWEPSCGTQAEVEA